MGATKVLGYKFALLYADKLSPTQKFYEKYFGFEKTAEFRPGEIYGKAGDIEMWIQEGYTKPNVEVDQNNGPTRVSVMFNVESVSALYEALRKNGERILLDEPQEMMPGTFFLKFTDPSGNIIDVLGGK